MLTILNQATDPVGAALFKYSPNHNYRKIDSYPHGENLTKMTGPLNSPQWLWTQRDVFAWYVLAWFNSRVLLKGTERA